MSYHNAGIFSDTAHARSFRQESAQFRAAAFLH